MTFGISLIALAAMQSQDPLAPLPQQQTRPVEVGQRVVGPPPLPADVFAAIEQKRWGDANQLIDRMNPTDPLEPVARAELYLAEDSPLVTRGQLESLLAKARELPQAAQLARLATRRGSNPIPVAAAYPLRTLGAAPRRRRAAPVTGDTVADELRAAFDPFVKADTPEPAEALYQERLAELSREGRAEIGQRVAWIYYVVGRDDDARRVAAEARAYGAGEWRAQASWVEALASWRMGDCNAASPAFRETALTTRDGELAAAAHYWSARAEQACNRPHEVQSRLRAAATNPESFYGQVARETLGMDLAPIRRVERPDERAMARIMREPNVARAVALAGIGRRALAEEMLKHQAAIGSPADQPALIEVARRLHLGGAQYWLATNGQSGAAADVADRYPVPGWQPDNGWRIDPFLAYAHIIQETDFRERAVSPADAVGLMQVRPGTARDTARGRGQSVSVEQLKIPETNLDHGQAFISLLRRDNYLQDQLPRIVAAYNAGPVPVQQWNLINDRGDPLLWMESLPYWETRFYVPAVLRNYFVYHALAGSRAPALKAIAEHRWPRYPER